ncbi:hypothetical protein N7448_005479 [Penicillium atrosanguineum]|uniref:GPI anchored cell wall protein n=1 Tax=Penicillium atrosanguineum TaxID=1132637 RepID=A0A9W9PNF3_9EURO|nr:uncharacterized protein N7443_009211 [Penicillium atrosanguineum]KAJ5126168.1 hypothetical protein N7526_008345 [Penicillium atrosanguineum]KAJ5136925.1 hypothetical protein N7448_005479 [Penicillium atrosanguineum]KAJ5293258.1 hypothetical protein N7443_009211 [Penicillium atrosanguineum]KAJ5302709.1 hypothetical protein N7476_009508 [Penicillium atrosanguineum]
MRFQSLTLLAGAAIAAADSTVTLFLPGFDTQPLDGKILGSSGAMTTYSLNCPSGEDSSDCGVPPGFIVTQGGSSMKYGYSYDSETVSEDCKFQGTTRATCWANIVSDGSSSSMSTAFDVTSIPYGGFMPVHVTATESGGAAASTGASVSATTATATGTSTGTSTGSATTLTSTGSDSSTATASSSKTESTNAAMPKMTGNARWVAGGAAAALALIAV